MKKGVYTSYTLTTLLRGLATVIDILANEISVMMAQVGRRRVGDLNADIIAPTNQPQANPNQ